MPPCVSACVGALVRARVYGYSPQRRIGERRFDPPQAKPLSDGGPLVRVSVECNDRVTHDLLRDRANEIWRDRTAGFVRHGRTNILRRRHLPSSAPPRPTGRSQLLRTFSFPRPAPTVRADRARSTLHHGLKRRRWLVQMRVRNALVNAVWLTLLASTGSSTERPPLPPRTASLVDAASKCDVDGVDAALRLGASVSETDEHGRTALDIALMAPCADEDVAVSKGPPGTITGNHHQPSPTMHASPPLPPPQVFTVVQRLYKHPSCTAACWSGTKAADGITPLHRIMLRWGSSFFPSRPSPNPWNAILAASAPQARGKRDRADHPKLGHPITSRRVEGECRRCAILDSRRKANARR